MNIKEQQIKDLKTAIDESKGKKGALIPVLQKAQRIFGYLPKDAMEIIAWEMNKTLSDVYGVATFYAQFYYEPHGRNTIQVCRGTACHVKESRHILEEIENHLGIKDGETTKDMEFTIETVACLGTCFLAPVIMINENYYGKLKPGEAVDVIEKYRKEARAHAKA